MGILGISGSRVVVTEPISSSAPRPITLHLPPEPEDHVAAVLDAWTGQGLSISDRRFSMRFEAGGIPDALIYYVVLSELVNRWVAVDVNQVPVDFQRIYEESRRLPDAGKPSPFTTWAQVGGEDPGYLPHVVVETEADLTPETVSLIRYASRLRMVPPARTKAAFVCLARVAGIRLARQRRLPFLSTGRELEPLHKQAPDQGVDLEHLRMSVIPRRKVNPPTTYDLVPPGKGRKRYRTLAEANAAPIEPLLGRLGSSSTGDEPVVWTCPRVASRHLANPKPSLRIRSNRAMCTGCDTAYLTPVELVARTLDITPDEAAALILRPDCVIDRPVPDYRRPELVSPPVPGTLVTAYVSADRPDRFDCVIYDAGIGYPREAIIWRPDTANLPPDVAPVVLKPGDTVTALVTEVPESGACHLSITSPALAARALASQVPEIIDGAATVVAVARMMNSRTKLAVAPTEERLNAVGAALGKRDNHYHLHAAHRLLNRHRLNEPPDTWERLEIIAYSADLRTYLMNAMRPVEVIDCRIRGTNAVVSVRPLQYRGGIGRGGLNAQLAGQLTGLYVRVVPDGADLDDPALDGPVP
ncbi:hypothetical protein [Nonomuraea sp. NPDC048826]|uniref:hypothetical protein n=1 Tax=Nonomuraea sp. NPDC048826 TaxID=3364347 RepID=UPI0037189CF3